MHCSCLHQPLTVLFLNTTIVHDAFKCFWSILNTYYFSNIKHYNHPSEKIYFPFMPPIIIKPRRAACLNRRLNPPRIIKSLSSRVVVDHPDGWTFLLWNAVELSGNTMPSQSLFVCREAFSSDASVRFINTTLPGIHTALRCWWHCHPYLFLLISFAQFKPNGSRFKRSPISSLRGHETELYP